MACHDSTDPANMTPEARLIEVAAILAEGLRRLQRRGAIPGQNPTETASESGRNCLDDPPETRLDGHSG
jgi:hypothetical protein